MQSSRMRTQIWLPAIYAMPIGIKGTSTRS